MSAEATPNWVQVQVSRGKGPFDVQGLPADLLIVRLPWCLLNLNAKFGVPEALRQLLQRPLEPDDRERCLQLFELWAHNRILDRDLLYLVQLGYETLK